MVLVGSVIEADIPAVSLIMDTKHFSKSKVKCEQSTTALFIRMFSQIFITHHIKTYKFSLLTIHSFDVSDYFFKSILTLVHVFELTSGLNCFFTNANNMNSICMQSHQNGAHVGPYMLLIC